MKANYIKLLLACASLTLAPVAFSLADVPAAKPEGQAPQAVDKRYTEKKSKDALTLIGILSEYPDQPEFQSLVKGLKTLHKAHLLRTMEFEEAAFNEHARVIIEEMLDFLGFLSMARTVVEESLAKSAITNQADYDATNRPMILDLIDKERKEQERNLRSLLQDMAAFRKMLDQVAAVKEVFEFNLTRNPKIRKAIQPHMKSFVTDFQLGGAKPAAAAGEGSSADTAEDVKTGSERPADETGGRAPVPVE